MNGRDLEVLGAILVTGRDRFEQADLGPDWVRTGEAIFHRRLGRLAGERNADPGTDAATAGTPRRPTADTPRPVSPSRSVEGQLAGVPSRSKIRCEGSTSWDAPMATESIRSKRLKLLVLRLAN